MKFYAITSKGCIITDDYDKKEIGSNLHLQHILEDLKEINYKGSVRVYDFNNRFVCKLKNGLIYR